MLTHTVPTLNTQHRTHTTPPHSHHSTLTSYQRLLHPHLKGWSRRRIIGALTLVLFILIWLLASYSDTFGSFFRHLHPSLIRPSIAWSTIDPPLIPFTPRSPPVIDLFIRTWTGDAHWLTYLLRSIETFVPRHLYRSVIITYDETESDYFNNFLSAFALALPIVAVGVKDPHLTERGPNSGAYYSQMYQKWFAYNYSDADYFVHLDSDNFFHRTIQLEDWVESDGRVFLRGEPFELSPTGAEHWQRPAEWLMQEPVPIEFMTGFPFIYPRTLYENARQTILTRHTEVARIHGIPPPAGFLEVARHCLESTNSFSEFSTLGHYLVTYMPSLVRTSAVHEKVGYLDQSWSWGGLDQHQITYFECVLRKKGRKECKIMRPT